MAQPAAAAQLEAVRSGLVTPNLATQAVGDLSKCQRKLPCLVKEAKTHGASVLITVETARIVDQAVVKVDLLSIDEDGRKLESFVAEGPNTTILEVVSAKTREMLLPTVKRASGVVEPVTALVVAAPVAEAPPVITPPAPPPPPQVIDVPPPTRAGGFARWVPGLLGVAAAGAGVGVFLSAATERERLSAGGLPIAEIRPLVETGKTKETLGIGLMAGGGAAVIASLIWVLAAPAAPATVSVVPQATGGSVVVGGTF